MKAPLILNVDDEPTVLELFRAWLTKAGYEVALAEKASQALEIVERSKPDLILLDVMMPEMDGYRLCAELQKREELALVPVVFLTALSAEQDRRQAIAAGGVEFLTKPLTREKLLETVKTFLAVADHWAKRQKNPRPSKKKDTESAFTRFKKYLIEQLRLNPGQARELASVSPTTLYDWTDRQRLPPGQIAKHLSEFLGWDYIPSLEPEDVRLGVLPRSYCEKNFVLPVRDAFVMSNPFDLNVVDFLRQSTEEPVRFAVTEPGNISSLLIYGTAAVQDDQGMPSEVLLSAENLGRGSHPVVAISHHLLEKAVAQGASDIHIEPKEAHAVVRFRLDGELGDVVTLEKKTGAMLIARFKALAKMDVAERRRPQDGSYEMVINSRSFKLRLATTSTPQGESLIMRLLEPGAEPKSLQELGMTPEQSAQMHEFSGRQQGLILVAGPTGSGKTTTLYSLLSRINDPKRSLITVEDPVEYRLPFANQQQVNEKAGITFEALLKSSVRQDPDILFVGEIRDPPSAKIALDFASTGHLTVTTLHTSNATTAVLRLERLGVEREAMAESILGVVAQRLLKKLCPHCKTTTPISAQEREMLKVLVQDMPERVCHPAGCPRCNDTGYMGREAVYEIIKFYPEIARLIRTGRPISEIRDYARQRGDYLISLHAVEKVRQGIFPPKEVYEKILLEEAEYRRMPAAAPQPQEPAPSEKPPPEPPARRGSAGVILVTEDSKDTQSLLKLLLEKRGYRVVVAGDGVEALVRLGQESFDLILSDVEMPHMDGFRLMEVLAQKEIKTPVIFVTAWNLEEAEAKALSLGAADYIPKPIKKDVLLSRIARILKSGTEHKA
jgi:type IV pilus assembly protein PilB